MRAFSGTKVLRWESWDGSGLEHCTIRSDELDFLAEGIVIAPAGENFGARYIIRFDAAWRTIAVSVAVLGREDALSITMDEDGLWHRDGQPLPELKYAAVPDISVTPLTNTFAIRRLNLSGGQSADIETAYFELPALRLFADPQRYTCLEEGRRYRYESRDSDFMREIEVDSDGFVTTYPGLFRRIV